MRESGADAVTVRGDEPQGPPEYKLYPESAVTLATFLGSAIAGGIVLAIDLRRLGRPREAWRWLLGTAFVTALLLTMALRLPEGLPGGMLWLLVVLVMAAVGRSMLRRPLAEHRTAGGEIASLWGAAGVGLASVLGMIVLLAVVAIFLPPFPGERVEARGSEIYVSGGATAGEGVGIVEILAAADLLDPGDGWCLHLAKSTRGFKVELETDADAWADDADADRWGREAADAIHFEGYGPQLELRLVDYMGEVWRTFSAP